jgi:hypothetical protein
VRQAGALELGDGLLDDRVPPVVGLYLAQRQVSVGDERVLVPRGEQRQLRPRCRSDAAHDQADLPGVALVAGEHGERGLGKSAPETCGVESQYGIGCHASSPIGSIAARTRLSCRAVMENPTSNFAAVARTFLE